MERVIMGNHAASYGAQLARAQVIAAYPITPQTQIIEMLSEFCADGRLNAKFITVESEHSAMAATIGAATAGARTFTATSSHGLALMHEMLHWAAGARLPIVMAEVNRAMGPGWSIWTDQNDSLSQRDTGWMQVYCESNQEVLDSVIQGYKIAETVLLPLMIVIDAFVLSHTSEAVDIPDIATVDRFLPPRKAQYKLDVTTPHAFGGLVTPSHYMEMRYKMQKAMEEALGVMEDVDREFQQIFGRSYGLLEEYRMDDAEVVLVTSGTITSTAREVIDSLREEGQRIGLLKMRVFRPFPTERARNALACAQKIAVIDRNISFGQGGIFAQEVRSALYDAGTRTPLFNFIVGLGGRDVTPTSLRNIATFIFEHETPPEDIIWWEVNK